jgi:hypothetical protein
MLQDQSKLPVLFESIKHLHPSLLTLNAAGISQQHNGIFPLEYALQENKIPHFTALIRLAENSEVEIGGYQVLLHVLKEQRTELLPLILPGLSHNLSFVLTTHEYISLWSTAQEMHCTQFESLLEMTLPKKIHYPDEYLTFIKELLLPNNHWSSIKNILNLINHTDFSANHEDIVAIFTKSMQSNDDAHAKEVFNHIVKYFDENLTLSARLDVYLPHLHLHPASLEKVIANFKFINTQKWQESEKDLIESKIERNEVSEYRNDAWVKFSTYKIADFPISERENMASMILKRIACTITSSASESTNPSSSFYKQIIALLYGLSQSAYFDVYFRTYLTEQQVNRGYPSNSRRMEMYGENQVSLRAILAWVSTNFSVTSKMNAFTEIVGFLAELNNYTNSGSNLLYRYERVNIIYTTPNSRYYSAHPTLDRTTITINCETFRSSTINFYAINGCIKSISDRLIDHPENTENMLQAILFSSQSNLARLLCSDREGFLQNLLIKCVKKNYWDLIENLLNTNHFAKSEEYSFLRWIFDEAMKVGEKAENLMKRLLQLQALIPIYQPQFNPSPLEDSSLHLAIRNDYHTAIRVLASNSACLIHENKDGEQPIFLAAKLKKWGFLHLILNENASHNSDKQDDTYGYVKTAQQLGAQVSLPSEAMMCLQSLAKTNLSKLTSYPGLFTTQEPGVANQYAQLTPQTMSGLN